MEHDCDCDGTRIKAKKITHTPTPWHIANNMDVDIYGDTGFRIAVMKGGEIMRDEANAAYIVRAVNAYAPMVEALKAAVKLMESKETAWAFHEDVFIQMREALRAAEGKGE
jgi:hypothetical protein